jgi:hypothetical protein
VVEEAGVAVVVRRGQPEQEEAGQLGRIRQLKLLKGPSIGHRWPAQEEVVVEVVVVVEEEEEVMEDLLGFRLIWPLINRRPLAPSLTE